MKLKEFLYYGHLAMFFFLPGAILGYYGGMIEFMLPFGVCLFLAKLNILRCLIDALLKRRFGWSFLILFFGMITALLYYRKFEMKKTSALKNSHA